MIIRSRRYIHNIPQEEEEREEKAKAVKAVNASWSIGTLIPNATHVSNNGKSDEGRATLAFIVRGEWFVNKN